MPLGAAGAGAAEGLDQMLQRMLLEEQLRQRGRGLDEESRHNKADEALRGRQIEELAATRKDANQLRQDALTDKTVNARGIGDTVTEPEFTKETGAGYPSGDYAISNFGSAPETESGKPAPAPRLISFKGTEAQRLAREKEQQGQPVNLEKAQYSTTDAATARALGVKPGDPFTVWMHPRTRALTSLAGQDLAPFAGKLKPYTPPQQPGFLQSGEGYVLKTDAANTLRGGGNVPLATPTTVRNRENMAGKIGSHFDDLESELDQANSRNLLGPLLGRYSDFMAGTVGSTGNPEDDDLLGRLRMDLGAATTGFASIHGRGNGANLGIAHDIQNKLATGRMSYEALRAGIQTMKKWVDTYATPDGSAAPAAPDMYSEYLKRTAPK